KGVVTVESGSDGDVGARGEAGCESCWEVVLETPTPRLAHAELGSQGLVIGEGVGDEGFCVDDEVCEALLVDVCGLDLTNGPSQQVG
ncbi:hypothetical protein A2U01_0058931, partial [Trifolium medium]|nr:hypothetical protein [Trifolium medium]